MRVPASLVGGVPKALGKELEGGACALAAWCNPGICAGAVQSARERNSYSTLPLELKQVVLLPFCWADRVWLAQ